MNLSITRTTYGGGDYSWLGSRRGVSTARSVTLSDAAFTGDVASGTPVAIVSGLAVPYNSAGSDGSQNLAGFVLGDHTVTGDTTVPLLDTGRVIVANLPIAFTAPANAGSFVFV